MTDPTPIRWAPMMLVPRVAPPTTELGHGQNAWWWSYYGGGDDPTPELQWPHNVAVYDSMYRQDAQVRSVIRGVSLPVAQVRRRLAPKDASDEVTNFVATNLGLPIVGQTDEPPPVPRRRDRFAMGQHVEWALKCTVYGHMFFEQVYRPDPSGRYYLRKLAPRWPKTIQAINVATDGGLVSIEQKALALPGRASIQPAVIPVSRLVAYSYEREGGAWAGNSLLRPAYKHWILKDQGLRVWAETIQRNGMGVPHYTAGEEEASLEAGTKLAQSYRSGATAGGAGPHGSQMTLLGVQGALPDTGGFVRYQDELIARAVLAHFMNLGQQQGTGSFALGSSFMDFFIMSLESLAGFLDTTMTQHIIEDLVDLNFGEQEPAPELVHDPIGQNPTAIVTAVQALIAAGAIFPDPALDAFVRQVVGLPPKAPLPGAQTPAGAAGPPAGTPGGQQAHAAAMRYLEAVYRRP
jgi:hypothetical protein